jgi:hypothetical protein
MSPDDIVNGIVAQIANRMLIIAVAVLGVGIAIGAILF